MASDELLTAIVVGTGFSGVAAAIALRKAGITSFVVLEKAATVGGTWRDNTYPGAACDVPSHLYSYSFAANPSWSRAYSQQPEILRYLQRCAADHGVLPHVRFGQEVASARWDEPSATWTVGTIGGAQLTARALILGNGALHIPALPTIPGMATFAGPQFHSARWNHAFELAGKRVAVIGTGASAIQFVPQIAARVAKLELFQRTPPWIVPKPDRAMRSPERWAFEHLPGAHWLRRTGLYWQLEARVLGFSYAPAVLKLLELQVRRELARVFPDPVLRAKLTPSYRLGCKRVLISNDYYPALARDNVEVVTDAITAIEPTGVRTADGRLHEVDALIFGTGFRATDYLAPIAVVGTDGRELNAEWRDATMRNYLGITVAGFPNLFLMMGPNTILGHNSMIFMIEAQARYAVDAIVQLERRGLASIDVRRPVEAAFRAELVRKLRGTVWTSGCTSWYQSADGGLNLWPGFTLDYWRRTRRVKLTDYDVRHRP